jgi:hypothetical protein
MCGIIGLIARTDQGFWQRDADLLEQLLIVNSLRGKDSTGVFTTFRNKQAEVLKLGSNPFNLFRTKEWADFRTSMVSRGRLVIGHNRAATKGAVTTENAHPFVENNIILVHNGTLWDHSKLSDKQFDVDSNAIAHALSESPIEEVLPKLRGAYALVWYDTEKQKLFAVRNDERPLFIIESDNMFVLSSEPMIAALPLSRQNRKIENVVEVPTFELLEFDQKGKMDSRKLEKPVVSYSSYSTTYKGNGKWGRDYKETVTQPNNVTKDLVEDSLEGDYWEYMSEGRSSDDCPLIIKESVETKGMGSKSCALTQVKDGQNDSSKSESENHLSPPNSSGLTLVPKKKASEVDRDAENNTRRIQIQHPTLMKGRMVLFKPHEITLAQQHFKFRGKLHEPGESLVDVIGCFPDEADPAAMVGKYCTGRILYVTNTVGGTSVYVADMRLASVVATHNKVIIPLAAWGYGVCNCTCMKCGKKMHEANPKFTSVSFTSTLGKGMAFPENVVKLMCSSCVEQALSGEEKDAFKQAREAGESPLRHRPVQNRVELSEGTSKKDGGTPGVQSSPTIH